MTEQIRPLTIEALCAQARDAAERGIPLSEANHHEPGTALWLQFNTAYLHAAAQECEVE